MSHQSDNQESEPQNESVEKSNEVEGTEGSKRGRSEGAQTFRRGRALHFLERLELRRETLTDQLQQQAFDSIHPVIAGELKAVDGIIREFIQVFEIYDKPEDCGKGAGGSRGRRQGEHRRGGKEHES